MGNNMDSAINDFLKLKIGLEKLKEKLGDNLHTVAVENPQTVYSKDLILLINQYVSGLISFLETLDEDGVQILNKEFEDMIECLSNNEVYAVS
jgi:hypothetical protein